jgi:hypothetical protein
MPVRNIGSNALALHRHAITGTSSFSFLTMALANGLSIEMANDDNVISRSRSATKTDLLLAHLTCSPSSKVVKQ